MRKDIRDYSDIINLERPKSSRKKMKTSDRAAQFAPFAALRGHKDAVDEKARETERRRILDENQKEIINNNLLLIEDLLYNEPLVKINHYVRDEKKLGGHYFDTIKNVKNIDKIELKLEFTDKSEIYIDDIYFIELINEE